MMMSMVNEYTPRLSLRCVKRVGRGSGLSTGRPVGSGWVRSVQIFTVTSLSGSGQVGSNCVGLRRSPWMIQNVTLNVFLLQSLHGAPHILETICVEITLHNRKLWAKPRDFRAHTRMKK